MKKSGCARPREPKPVLVTELHLHESDRIFGGEGEGDMPAVSRPLRGRGCTRGNHGHRADLLLCAQGATVGMRSSWHPVVGKRRPSMPVAGALLAEFPSAQFAARCWSADRWARGWHCEQGCGHGHVRVPAAWHRDTLCHVAITCTTGIAGKASTARRQRLRARAFQGDWIGDEVLQTDRLRQACPLPRSLYISLSAMA